MFLNICFLEFKFYFDFNILVFITCKIFVFNYVVVCFRVYVINIFFYKIKCNFYSNNVIIFVISLFGSKE